MSDDKKFIVLRDGHYDGKAFRVNEYKEVCYKTVEFAWEEHYRYIKTDEYKRAWTGVEHGYKQCRVYEYDGLVRTIPNNSKSMKRR